jgi:tetratricopeptide (TPR) repeat protein
MLASLLLRGGKLGEARPELAKMLEAGKTYPAAAFTQVFQLLSAYPDKPAALEAMRGLAQPYAGIPEAHWSVAQLARQANDPALALSAVREARKLRPSWDMAALLEAQLLHKEAPLEALEVLKNYLLQYPDARDVRLQYARALLEQKQYRPSRAEFQRLANELPDNPDMAFAVALISLQLKDLQGAETQFQQALEKGKQDRDTVQYYLGQLKEAKEDEEAAIAHYREVKGGEYAFAARLRVAFLLNKHGRLDEAVEYLREAQTADNRQRAQQIMIEAQLLHEAKHSEEAYQVLRQGLDKLPNHPDLLYETAMLADKIGKLGEFEELMRKLIQIKPDHAHAYNALGYRLLDFDNRIPEALELVEKALLLAPGDFAIMDSVGWGYFRSGRLEESEQMLRRAHAGNPDPEIAAHLGEVLWVRGNHEEAKKVWQKSLETNPGNALLQAVMQRLMP